MDKTTNLIDFLKTLSNSPRIDHADAQNVFKAARRLEAFATALEAIATDDGRVSVPAWKRDASGWSPALRRVQSIAKAALEKGS